MKELKYLLLAALVAFLSSCITVEEFYSFKADGSGSSSFKINMSEMKTMMESMGTQDDSQENSLEAMDFDAQKSVLEKVEGISNVQTNVDHQNYVFDISYDFANKEALNTAINVVFETKDHTYFDYNKKKYEFSHPLPKTFEDTSKELEGDYMKAFLEKVKYDVVIVFKENSVKKVTSEAETTLSVDKKELVYSTNLSDMIESPEELNSVIKLK